MQIFKGYAPLYAHIFNIFYTETGIWSYYLNVNNRNWVPVTNGRTDTHNSMIWGVLRLCLERNSNTDRVIFIQHQAELFGLNYIFGIYLIRLKVIFLIDEGGI